MSSEVDKEGFLTDRSRWNEEVAQELATREGIVLEDAHWQVVRVARAFYDETGVSPEMRPLVKLARERIGPEAGSSIYLLRLFPGNPAKLVAKIGGLPRPTNCL
jgi:tRNA 2-thiouridine synthesizing protein E